MPVTLEAFGLDRLTRDEKITLVGQLLDSISESESGTSRMSAAQVAELERRLADARANPNDWISWEDALANTMKRHAQ